MIDRKALMAEILELSDKLDDGPQSDLMRRASVALTDALGVISEYDLAMSEADAGKSAQPCQNPDIPQPTEDGKFLLIFRDSSLPGGVSIRRYATKADAHCIAFNQLGYERWAYEIVEEIDLVAMDPTWGEFFGGVEEAA